MTAKYVHNTSNKITPIIPTANVAKDNSINISVNVNAIMDIEGDAYLKIVRVLNLINC